ncbi:MAG: hypothetical protein RLZZ39_1089, partial [Actinomycetota bacterium]
GGRRRTGRRDRSGVVALLIPALSSVTSVRPATTLTIALLLGAIFVAGIVSLLSL